MTPSREAIEAAARAKCKRHGTAQCAAICLQLTATFTRGGQCPEAVRVWGEDATTYLTAAYARDFPQPTKSDEGRARNLDADLFWMRDTGNADAREQLKGRPARLSLFCAFAAAIRAEAALAATDTERERAAWSKPSIPDDWAYSTDFAQGWAACGFAFVTAIRKGE